MKIMMAKKSQACSGVVSKLLSLTHWVHGIEPERWEEATTLGHVDSVLQSAECPGQWCCVASKLLPIMRGHVFAEFFYKVEILRNPITFYSYLHSDTFLQWEEN